MHKKMTIKSRLRSISYAVNGIKVLIQGEPNAQLHLVATLLVAIAGIVKHLNAQQWVLLIIAVSIVWITEALNTCIEKLSEFACKGEIHPTIKIIKDISAGAVLIAACSSILMGLFIFFL